MLYLVRVNNLNFVALTIYTVAFAGGGVKLRDECALLRSVGTPRVTKVIGVTHFAVQNTFLVRNMKTLLLTAEFIPEFKILGKVCFSMFRSISTFYGTNFSVVNAPKGRCASLARCDTSVMIGVAIVLLVMVNKLNFFM